MGGSADCVVVGGGIAGLMCALRVASAGMKTVLVERDRLGAGATTSNHGIVHSGALFAQLHPEVVAACREAQPRFVTEFPNCIVPSQPAWYAAQPARLEIFQRLWTEQSVAFGEVSSEAMAVLLRSRGRSELAFAAVNEVIISTTQVIKDLTGRCGEAGVLIMAPATATKAIVYDGRVIGVRVGSDGHLRTSRVVLCAGLGTAGFLRASGSALAARFRSRLDLMVAYRRSSLRQPILSLDYGAPTIAPAAGEVALASRYGGAQPEVQQYGRWPVPVADAAVLTAELAQLLRHDVVDLASGSAWVCSKTEYAAGRGDRWGVEPQFAVIDHADEGITGFYTVLPGKMTLALHASRALGRLVLNEPLDELDLPLPARAFRGFPSQLLGVSPWLTSAHTR